MKEFSIYHRENPEIYEQFEKFALYLLEHQGMKKIGAKMIMERIRWEIYIQKKSEYKINNSYTADYARMFIQRHPKYVNCFEFRKRHGNHNHQLELM